MNVIDELKDTNRLLFLEFPSFILESQEFSIHEILPNENLMDISFRYYNTIDLWWVLYYFNQQEFSMVMKFNNSITEFVNKLRTYILNPDTSSEKELLELKESIRSYYVSNDNTLIEAISKTKFMFDSPPYEEIENFLESVETEILEKFSLFKIKVPKSSVLYEIVKVANNTLKDTN